MLKSVKDKAKVIADPQRALNRTTTKLYGLLRQMLLWGEKRAPWRKLMIEGNPALMIPKAQIAKIQDSAYKAEREGVLQGSEIKELADILGMNKLTYAPNASASAPFHLRGQCVVWICLGTMCRIGELLMSKWEHIDFDKKTWFIAAENTKTQAELIVYLPPLSCLSLRIFFRILVVWLFASHRKTKTVMWALTPLPK